MGELSCVLKEALRGRGECMSYDDYDQDAAEARFDDEIMQLERIEELEELVRDMYENFTRCYVKRSSFEDVCFNDCPHNKSFSCNLRVDYFERMLELGLIEDE